MPGKLSERWSIEIGDLLISNLESDLILHDSTTNPKLESLNYKGFTIKLTKGRFRYLGGLQNKDLIKDFTMNLYI